MSIGFKEIRGTTSSITEVKRSPMDVFDQARKAETGVYIFNREKVAGVMLTQEQYETLLQELADLRESVKEEVRINEESKQVLDNFTDSPRQLFQQQKG